MKTPLECRKDFDILKSGEYVYFDNAATSQRPRQVLEAVSEFYKTTNANPLRGLYDWSMGATERYEGARKTVASFIGASAPEEIIFTRNTTESLNLVAYSYGLDNVKEGDEIVITVMEHHSNMLPWQMVVKKNKAKLIYLEPDEEGVISREEYTSKITDKTRIVAVGHVSNVMGVTNPVKEITEYAHSKGAIVVVDGAQSAPHMKVDVQDIGCDFFAFSGHKMLAPMGIGALYGRKELLENMQPFLTGGEMIEYVTREDATYAELPHKFEAGTVNAGGAVGLAAAIDYIESIGIENIAEIELELTELALSQIKEIPHVTVLGSDKAEDHHGIITFKIDGVHPHDIAAIMADNNVAVRAGHHCAEPLHHFIEIPSTTRASIMFYNTEDEVLKFVDTLKQIRPMMGYED